jgi:hypothetical protein
MTLRDTRGALLLALMGAALLPPPASVAQDMDDGEARVRSRSDVQMRVASGPATNAKRLTQLAGVLGGALTPVKQCYAKELEERPTVEGDLKIELRVPERGKTQVRVTSDAVGDAPVVRCAVRALQRLDYGPAPRPSSAFIHYTFTHSAATGVHVTRKRTGRAQGAVTRNEDGVPEAGFATPRREVRFTVTGQKKDSDERVTAVHAGMRSAVPGMLDCRRRAAKRERSPEGTVDLAVQVSRTGRAQARAIRSTVASPIAKSCLTRAIGRTSFDRSAAGRWSLRVHFAPYGDDS